MSESTQGTCSVENAILDAQVNTRFEKVHHAYKWRKSFITTNKTSFCRSRKAYSTSQKEIEEKTAALYISFENHGGLLGRRSRGVYQYIGRVLKQSDMNLRQSVPFILLTVSGGEKLLQHLFDHVISLAKF